MGDVVEGEGAASAIFEPLLGGLVASDVEVLCQFGYIGEALILVYPYTAVLVLRLVNGVAAGVVELGVLGSGHILHQVQTTQLAAEVGQAVIFFLVFGVRDARKVNLKEFFVRGAIVGRVQHGVDIVEEFLWVDGLTQSLFYLLHYFLVEVGLFDGAVFAVKVTWENA